MYANANAANELSAVNKMDITRPKLGDLFKTKVMMTIRIFRTFSLLPINNVEDETTDNMKLH